MEGNLLSKGPNNEVLKCGNLLILKYNGCTSLVQDISYSVENVILQKAKIDCMFVFFFVTLQ